jgi:antitoxin MazE
MEGKRVERLVLTKIRYNYTLFILSNFKESMSMEAMLRKWGNSIGLRIPAGLLAELGLSENSTVDLRVEDGKLIVAPRRRGRRWKYSLDELLAGVTEDNVHPETDWGASVGDEAW